MTTATAAPASKPTAVNIETFIDPERPMSWSRQMVALLHAGHYGQAYEILAEKMPFVENQLRPYAEKLAGKENHWTLIHDWISKYIDDAKPQRILDVGCAVGGHAMEFARRGHNAWGIDILSCMIERGQELAESLELSERCQLMTGDIRQLERYYEPHFFDTVVANDIFEHLNDSCLMEMLRGIKHVLRPGGTLVIQTSPGLHYYWFEPDRWKMLLLLVPFAWLPDRAFSAYVRGLDRWYVKKLRHEPVQFYRHEHGHINCMDPIHLRRLLEQAGLCHIRTFAVHAHPGYKDEGCLKKSWLKWLFGKKSIACRNVFGIATTPTA